MGMNDFQTPKAIANRIKAKGLQKLRWYCQLCQKQCRDDHGFKCHCNCESHKRQMEIFGLNPDRIVEQYSEQFEELFLQHMKIFHRFSRIAATVVYNEFISNRHHVHMNSTKWLSLTEFVEYLGRTQKCNVEATPKGLFITYIHRDSETVFKSRTNDHNKRVWADLVEEEKKEMEILRQIKRAGRTRIEAVASKKTVELAGGKVAFALGGGKGKGMTMVGVFEDDHIDGEKASKRPKVEKDRVLDELMAEDEKVKEKINRKDYWLCEGIVVKVIMSKMKGVVKKVIDKYVAEIETIDDTSTKHVVRIDQAEVETVIPQIGGRVRIVNGAYRGCNAKLLGINMDKFCATVQIEKGVYDGRIVPAVDYEDICKLA